MNFFSCDALCESVAAAFFPEDQVDNKLFELDGKLWRIPTINQTTPITDLPFQSRMLDFFEGQAISDANTADEAVALKYLPRVSHGIVRAEEWLERNLEKTYEPAPTILWEDFENWEAFLQSIKKRKSKKFLADSRRRRRKLEEAVGPLEFVLNDTRPGMLKTCMAWKSQQYFSTGQFDDFSQEENVRLFEELVERGLLMVSSLSSAEGPIAIDLNLFHEGRLYSWIASYDSEYSNYAPGRLLLLEALEASLNAGHREFDFLIGNEDYKWIYASHARLIGSLGVAPLKIQAQELMASSVKPALAWGLQSLPGIKGKLKTLAVNSQKG